MSDLFGNHIGFPMKWLIFLISIFNVSGSKKLASVPAGGGGGAPSAGGAPAAGGGDAPKEGQYTWIM